MKPDVPQLLRDARSRDFKRSFRFVRESSDIEKRTVDMSFASAEPVERYFGDEVLEISEKACDLSRLNSGAPLLVNHDTNDQVGVVERAWIDNASGKARCTVRFSRSARGEEIFQDVNDGIRSLVSVGYCVNSMVPTGDAEGDGDSFLVNQWQPYEVSIVPVPADASVGVGRSKPVQEEPVNVQVISNKMSEVNVASIEASTRSAELARINEIQAISERFNVPADMKSTALRDGVPVDQFRRDVMEKVLKAEPIKAPHAGIGMSEKEKRSYSFLRALNALANGERLSGLEKEASDEMAKQTRRNPQGFFIPTDILTARQNRALSAVTATAGGYTVQTDVLGGSMIELLRNRQKLIALGAKQLSGLVGNVAIPSQTGGATTYWLAAGSNVTAADQTFGQLALEPHRLSAATGYDKQLLAQGSIDVESFVRDDLMNVIAIEKDRVGINGLGAAGEPLGILNTSGLATSVTFGGAATWAKVLEFETNVATANADVDTMAYLTTPATRGKWKGTPKVSAQAIYLWDNGMVNGYRAEATNQVPSNKVIFGNFADTLFADWAGVDVVVDPYSLSLANQVRVVVNIMTDFGVRHAKSFAISTDSGAQ